MPAQKAYLVYIFKNRMNRRFIGITEDAEDELRRHNKGEFRGTKPFRPWQLEWLSDPLTKNQAARLEGDLRHHKTNTNMIYTVIRDHELAEIKKMS